MAKWDALVDDERLGDQRFAPYWKKTPAGTAWAVTRIKAAMRDVFEDLKRVETPDELCWLLEGSRVELEACWCALPEWCDEFEEQVMAVGMMPRFEVKPAERAIRNVIIGLAGEPGGGKTCSALRLATGLAGPDGGIVLIDTECGKATEFAPRRGEEVGKAFDPNMPLFNFGVIELDPPFSPDRYRIAVAAAAKAKPKVLIIDNITDEMYGEGGMLDTVNAAGGEVTQWSAPREAHRKLMNKLRAHPWYVIMTIRAEEKMKIEKQPGMKMRIEKQPLAPRCDKGLYFDCTVLQLVDGGVPSGATERPWKLPPALRAMIGEGKPFTEETGRKIAEWAQPRGSWGSDASDE